MDFSWFLVNALASLSAYLGVARGYVAARVVLTGALSRWMGVLVMVIAGMALVSSGAHAQSRVDAVASPAMAPVEPVRTDQQGQKGEFERPGSAIYSPFSSGPHAPERSAVASKASSAPEPGLTMTLTASMAGVVALVWLLQRV